MTPLRQRVVVTGLGLVCSVASDVRTFFARCLEGSPGVSRLPELGAPGLDDAIAAAIPGWDPSRWLPGRVLQTASKASQYAYAAAVQAFAAAGLERLDRRRGGVYVGTGFGGLSTSEETYRACFSQPGTRPRPTVIPTAMTNSTAALLATELRLKGPNLTFGVACASGTHAIGQAYRLLRAGDADLMLAGGTDAPITPIILSAWNAMRVLAPAGDDPQRACRPFDRTRQGLVVGEGAGFLVLESLAHAERRGARIHGEVIGYGANADAGHITHPDLEGVGDCIAAAVADAGVDRDAIGYVNAHGTGTLVNDRTEADALAGFFGDHARRLLVSSTKAVHGHAMGASGALEAIVSLLAMADGLVPPTANLVEPAPDLPRLDFVLGEARKAAIEVALSTSFAFGGNNAALVLRRAA